MTRGKIAEIVGRAYGLRGEAQESFLLRLYERVEKEKVYDGVEATEADKLKLKIERGLASVAAECFKDHAGEVMRVFADELDNYLDHCLPRAGEMETFALKTNASILEEELVATFQDGYGIECLILLQIMMTIIIRAGINPLVF
jgi:hypothetical protein